MSERSRWIALALVACLAAGPPEAVGRQGGEPAAPDEIRAASSAGEVVFPHRLHAEDLGMECAECHHETDAATLGVPHREYFADFWVRCETCHGAAEKRRGPSKCGSCHHERPADIADETLSVKVVVHRSCWRCHDVGTGAEASAGCRACHRPDPSSPGAAPAEEDASP